MFLLEHHLHYLKFMKQFIRIKENIEGRVGVPILLYLLGVPGSVCLLIWFFFFRDRY